MNVRAIREALAKALEPTGLRTLSVLPEKLPTPCAVVGVPEVVEYHQAGGRSALARVQLPVTVVLGRLNSERAQESIDTYCSLDDNHSVPMAIEADRTLGGTAQTTQVRSAETFRTTDNDIAIDFIVEVFA
jgi:hypothetical protein